MPAGMKPLEKFLKKQTNALTRAGGFGGEKAAAGTSAARRRASLSRVVPFFRESSPEGGPARGDVFSPETEEAPCWPSAAATDIRSPSLSSDEQSSEASLDTGWTPLPADTPENLALALLDSVAGKRYGNCTADLPTEEEGISLVMWELFSLGAFQVDIPVKAACVPVNLHLGHQQTCSLDTYSSHSVVLCQFRSSSHPDVVLQCQAHMCNEVL
ncbi:hypothetical protein Baya_5547 [Bagarius yarrelli]|uniref:Uncharacterized protein n=1 Tax=Bagarius yarrelli TaxID=175774 RepID=A0A556TUZ9_BAGYA|nr:hypothetical protein Baya_5547 [Bagarius yarrelli]